MVLYGGKQKIGRGRRGMTRETINPAGATVPAIGLCELPPALYSIYKGLINAPCSGGRALAGVRPPTDHKLN